MQGKGYKSKARDLAPNQPRQTPRSYETVPMNTGGQKMRGTSMRIKPTKKS